MLRTAVLSILLIILSTTAAHAGVRIKDITDLEGARGNQLVGFGLVVGLDGTGSRTPNTQKVAVDVMQRFAIGSKITSDTKADNLYKSENISLVLVTAELGPFSRKGSRLDVTVSVYDDAKSLQVGTLLLTPLRGADGEVYATAQGPLTVGGYSFSGAAASAQKNHPTVARGGRAAYVEREARSEILCNGQLRFLLRDPDYTTVRAITRVIADRFPGSSMTLDAGTVQVSVPREWQRNLFGFISEIGVMEVMPDAPARVVINERTGTIVAGEHVKIARTAIAHGSLSIVTAEEPQVSQPEPLSKGKTVVVPRTRLGVTEQAGSLQVVEPTVTVAELARALNALGVTPRDLIAIFEALKECGALHAEVVHM